MDQFDGLGMGLGTLSRLSAAQTRSISAENPTGKPSRGGMATEGTEAVPARELGQGWKVSPSIEIAGWKDVRSVPSWIRPKRRKSEPKRVKS